MRSASRRAVRGGLAVALAAGLLAAAPPSSPLSPARAAAQTDGGDSGAPSVVKMEITSDPGADLTYGLGDEIEVEVTFSEKVMVDTAGGVPRLLIDFSTEGWGHKWAGYASGSGTSVLAFTHTVVVPNYSSQGVAVPANGLEANGGSITSVASGTAAVLSYSGLEHNPDHLVDAALTDNAAPPDDAPPPDDAALSDARVPRQTPGPTITISGGSAVTEGSAATFTVTATAAPTADLTVNLSVSEAAGSDFVASGDEGSKMVTIAMNSTSATFSVSTVADAVDEPDGSVTVTVSTGTGYTVGSSSSASVTVNDNDSATGPTITISGGSAVNEGSAATFTVTASSAPTADLTVNLSVSEAAGSDFVASGDEGSKMVTIAMNSTSATFSVSTVADAVDEPDGSVTVAVAAGTGYSVGVTDSASVTVNDVPQVTISGGSAVTEGSAATFTVTASPAPSVNLAVNLSVSEGTGDFVASGNEGSKTVTITMSSTSATFSVPTVADTVDEGTNGSVTVAVAEGTGYTVGSSSSASVTVNDNDAAPTAVTLSANPSTVTENGGAKTVTVTATPTGTRFGTAKTVVVSVEGSGTASAVDFAAVSDFNVPILAGAASGSATFTLTPTNDNVDETNETVTVSGTLSGVTVSDATVSLTDDDAAPTAITLSLTDASDLNNIVDLTTVTENGGAKTVTVTATVTSSTRFATDQTVVVRVAGSNTASAVDFAAVSDFNVTILAGAASGSATFVLTPTNDNVDETNETVTVSGALSGVTVTSDTLSITDDDAAPTAITLSLTDASDLNNIVDLTTVTENGGAKTVTVTATVTSSTRFATDQTVVVSVAGSNTASAVDFAAVSDFNVTIAAGAASGSATFVLTPTNDNVDETNETVTVSGALSGVTVTSDTLSLTDDDAAPTAITLSLTDASDPHNIVDLTTVAENGGAKTVTVTATVTSSTRFATAKTVVVSVAGSGVATAVDFAAVSNFNVPIAAGAASGSATFTLTPTNDVVDETNETVTVSGDLSGVTVSDATVSLTDDDAAPTAITLSLTDASDPHNIVDLTTVAENGGAKTVTVTATVTSSTRFATAKTVVVSVAGSGVATAVDFAAVSNFNITISAEAASGSATFVLTPTNDVVDETNETVTVSGALSGVTVTSDTLSLTDDDAAPTGIMLSTNPSTVTENGGAKTVTVTARPTGGTRFATAKTVVVSVAGSGVATAVDFAAVSNFNVPIAAGAASGSATFTLTPTNDVVDETNETVTVSGDLSGVTVSDATVSLTDDDAAPTAITLSLTDASDPHNIVDLTTVAENGGAKTVTVTATVTSPTRFATDKTVVVSVAGSGVATAVDFAAVSNFNITISAEAASGSATFVLTPTNDVVDETNETVTVSGALSGVTVTSDTLSLTDDDAAPTGITLSLTDASDPDNIVDLTTVSESAAKTVTVTATVTGGTTYATDKTVVVSVAGSGIETAVDFTPVSNFNITISAEATSNANTFTLTPTNDVVDETNETITVSGALSGVTVVSDTLSLTDDDAAPTGISLSASPSSVSEGAGATTVTVTATVTGGTTYATAKTVAVSVAGTGVETAVDFAVSASSFNIAVAAEATTGSETFTLTPDDDETDEDHEAITISGALAGVTVRSGAMDIRDNDGASTQITLTVSATNLDESADPPDASDPPGTVDPTLVTVTATLDASALATDTTVTLALDETDSTATKGSDYADPGTLSTITISKDTKSGMATVSLDPIQDTLDEGDGEIIRIGGTHSGSLTVTDVDVTIDDDDDTPTDVDLSVSPTSVSETDTSVTTVTVSARLRGAATRTSPTVVNLNGTLGGTARAGQDYTHTALSASSITIPTGSFGGSSTVTFDVTTIQDPAYEGPETIQVLGSTPVAGLTVNSATLDLNDADVPRIDLSIDADVISAGVQTSMREDERAQWVTVTAAHHPDTADEDRARPVTVTVTVGAAGSTAERGADGDYTAAQTVAVRIAANAASGRAGVWITPRQDSAVEGTETIVFGGRVGDGTEFQVRPTTMTLLDDDTDSTGLVLLVNRDSVDERVPLTEVRVTAELNGKVLDADTTVTLGLSGTATAGEGNDYTFTPAPLVIEIPAGEASGFVAVDISPEDDSIDEGDGETISFSGTHAGVSPPLPVSGVDVTIVDDDTASTIIALSASPSSIAENGPTTAVTLTAKLAGTVTRSVPTTVTFVRTLGGTATPGPGNDFTRIGLPVSITIAAESSSASATGFSITPGQDTANEGVETIEVSAELAGYKVHAATVWLVDDDVSAPGAPGEFTAELVGRNAVRLTWTAPTAPDDKPVTAYRLERRKGVDDWEVVSDTIADTAVSYSNGGLEYDTVYWWRLSAQNTDGWGPATAAAEVMTRRRPPPVFDEPSEPEEPEEPTRPSPPAPPPEGFQLQDVPESSVFADEIATAVNLGIFDLEPVEPDPDDPDPDDPEGPAFRFGPQQPLSRGDVAAPLVRLWSVLGQRCPRIPTRLRLADVAGAQARLDVGCLLELGITTGTTRTTYSPEEPLTRAQTASMLARTWTASGRECPTDSQPPFTDIADSVHHDDIACLHALGITTGTGATTFTPERPITREEAAVLVARLHSLATEEEPADDGQEPAPDGEEPAGDG